MIIGNLFSSCIVVFYEWYHYYSSRFKNRFALRLKIMSYSWIIVIYDWTGKLALDVQAKHFRRHLVDFKSFYDAIKVISPQFKERKLNYWWKIDILRISHPPFNKKCQKDKTRNFSAKNPLKLPFNPQILSKKFNYYSEQFFWTPSI